MTPTERKSHYKKLFKIKEGLDEKLPSDYSEILKRDVLSLNDLRLALSEFSPKSLDVKAKETLEFYKENSLWRDLPEKVPHHHKIVLPFPELLIHDSIADLCFKIFKEDTRLLRRTIKSKISNWELSCLNWWYFVKHMYPEIDNQLLIQFSCSQRFSFEPSITSSFRFNGSLAEFARGVRRGDFHRNHDQNIFEYFFFEKETNQNFHFFNKMSNLFKVWPERKRLNILTQLNYPFSTETNDGLSMFSVIPPEQWDCRETNPSLYKKIISINDLRSLHDFLMVLSRKIASPLKPMDQSKINFLNNKSFKDYSFKVPSSNHDLDLISYRLNNCVGRGGYFEKIISKNSFIIEVLKEGKSFACVEYSIPTRRVIQAKINNNRPLPDTSVVDFIQIEINNTLKFSIWNFIFKLFNWMK